MLQKGAFSCESIIINGADVYKVSITSVFRHMKKCLIEYVPETDEDDKIIEKYGDIYSTPAYLIKVIPCIMADGNVLQRECSTSRNIYNI